MPPAIAIGGRAIPRGAVPTSSRSLNVTRGREPPHRAAFARRHRMESEGGGRFLPPQIFAAPLARASSSAFSTRGGDIGSDVKRTPVALAMALATAAMGGQMGVSPTPRTP